MSNSVNVFELIGVAIIS